MAENMENHDSGGVLEYLSVDRIEADIAVLERDDRSSLEIPVSELPEGVREGDCLLLQNGVLIIDENETNRRRNFNARLFRSLLADED